MCGILFSSDNIGLGDMQMLERRGPESKKTITNDLGYFFHSNLNTIGDITVQPIVNKKGILLYNGSTYGISGNDAIWLSESLDDNLEHNIEVVRSMRGEYALVYVTDEHIIFCTDHFYQRNLWFYHNISDQKLTVSSIPMNIINKHGVAWRCEENKIYILYKDKFKLDVIENKSWDLEQYKNDFDFVFEKFEQAILDRHAPSITTNLQSSGMDSGVINAATYKLRGSDFSSVCDVKLENKEILFQRNKLHRTYPLTVDGRQSERPALLSGISNTDMWDEPETDPLLQIIRNYVRGIRNHKVLITGNGGDEIYNDWQGQLDGRKLGRSSGKWPESLNIIWPYHNHYPRMTRTLTVFDYVGGFYGVEIRNPLLDTDLVQAWLNTTARLKNTEYKGWMQQYMRLTNYPYTTQKIHFNEHVG
jgi:asparagine synthetase B (glutamine-hydrolysing)